MGARASHFADCLIGLHLADHAMYRIQIDNAVWLADAREAAEVTDWMRRE
jgi:hypothetical protein